MISALDDIKNEYFNDVIIYSISEPGAMGCAGEMEFITSTGKAFRLNYKDNNTPYSLVREAFPEIQGNYFNGPETERTDGEPREMVFFFSEEPRGSTCIRDGWKHIYMGFGNHLMIREDHFDEFKKAISDLSTEFEIYDGWLERALDMYCGGSYGKEGRCL